MIGAKHERGTALIWAILILMSVSIVLALLASVLSRETSLVRHWGSTDHLKDLAQSERLLRVHLESNPEWTGAASVRLLGGSLHLERATPGTPAAVYVEKKLSPEPDRQSDPRDGKLPPT